MEGNGPDSSRSKIKSSHLNKNRVLLVVLSQNMFGRTFVLQRHRTSIGNGPSCDIRLEDPHMGEMQCVLELNYLGELSIENTDSPAATFVNNRTVKKKTKLFYGDRIVAGATVLRVFLEEKLEI
jgi:pSer/pThr/pTyr-binding forkhead associated (FHA) protein